MPVSNHSPVGTMLVQAGLLTQESLDVALAECDSTNRSLGRVLIDRGMVTDGDLISVIAKQMGMEYVDLVEFPVDVGAVMMVPASLARKYTAIPVQRDGKKLLVAMEDPSNVFAVDDIRSITGCDVRTAFATKGAIADAINKYYRADTVTEGLTAEASHDFEEEDSLASVKTVDEDAPIIRLRCHRQYRGRYPDCFDIHVEPTERDLLIRYRVDGVLHESTRMPKNIQMAITSRSRFIGEMNIAERRGSPQSGRIKFTLAVARSGAEFQSFRPLFGERSSRFLDSPHTLARPSSV